MSKIDKLIEKLRNNPIDVNISSYFDEPENVDKASKYQALIVSNPYELKRIFSLCHDEIWNARERNAQDAFDEFSKMLFLKMYDELENITDKQPYIF